VLPLGPVEFIDARYNNKITFNNPELVQELCLQSFAYLPNKMKKILQL
jgi:hypothetical protein